MKENREVISHALTWLQLQMCGWRFQFTYVITTLSSLSLSLSLSLFSLSPFVILDR